MHPLKRIAEAREDELGEQVRLVDRTIELYCDWRTGCAQVEAAYERFLDASDSDRALGFAVYVAALDREQSACESYADHIRLIESRYTDESSRAGRRETSDCGR